MRLLNKNYSGFTLIELLVVIAIIGLLASVVLVAMNNARVKARDAKRQADIKQINTALQLYSDDHGGKPLSTGGTIICLGLTSAQTCWSGFTGSSTVNSELVAYISKVPLDPLPNRAYGAYAYSSPGSYWSIPDAGFVHGDYTLSWEPDDVAATNASDSGKCRQMGGIWGLWDYNYQNAAPSWHNLAAPQGCSITGSCRQCGIVVK